MKVIIELSKIKYYDIPVEVEISEEGANVEDTIEKIGLDLMHALQENRTITINGVSHCFEEACRRCQKNYNGISEADYLGYEEDG